MVHTYQALAGSLYLLSFYLTLYIFEANSWSSRFFFKSLVQFWGLICWKRMTFTQNAHHAHTPRQTHIPKATRHNRRWHRDRVYNKNTTKMSSRPKSPGPPSARSDKEESFWDKIGTLGRKKRMKEGEPFILLPHEDNCSFTIIPYMVTICAKKTYLILCRSGIQFVC